MPVRIYTDRAFVEETTGSRRGFREWRFGIRSGEWYQLSALETFIRTNQPAGYAPRWTTYGGKGCNLFGMSMSAGHGHPGPIILLKPDMLNDYFADATDAEKLRVYNIFLAKDRAKVNELAERMWEKRSKAE